MTRVLIYEVSFKEKLMSKHRKDQAKHSMRDVKLQC